MTRNVIDAGVPERALRCLVNTDFDLATVRAEGPLRSRCATQAHVARVHRQTPGAVPHDARVRELSGVTRKRAEVFPVISPLLEGTCIFRCRRSAWRTSW